MTWFDGGSKVAEKSKLVIRSACCCFVSQDTTGSALFLLPSREGGWPGINKAPDRYRQGGVSGLSDCELSCQGD